MFCSHIVNDRMIASKTNFQSYKKLKQPGDVQFAEGRFAEKGLSSFWWGTF